MNKKTGLFITFVALVLLCMGTVLAQNATVTENGPPVQDYTVFLGAVGSWLVYALLGAGNAFIKGDGFDATKVTRSFLWAIVVAIVAVVLGIYPQDVIVLHEGLVSEVVATVMSSTAILPLIIFFDKGYRILKGLFDKWKELPQSPR